MVFDDLFDTVILTKDDESVFNAIFNYLFQLNRYFYAKDEHDDNGNLIYRPPPSEDVWIDEQGHRNCRHELENQCRRQDDRIYEKNCVFPDIISLNTRDKDARPPTSSSVSDYKLCVEH